jgi:hypothetical protein
MEREDMDRRVGHLGTDRCSTTRKCGFATHAHLDGSPSNGNDRWEVGAELGLAKLA